MKSYATHQKKIVQEIITKDDIVERLKAMGIQNGSFVYVQSVMSSFGYVVGGAQAIIEALMETVGYEGTIMMPTFTQNYVDPSCLPNTRITRENWRLVRENILPYDKKLSTPFHMGDVAVQFVKNDAVLRSSHPNYSFAVWGKYAKIICEKHALHFGLSKESPLGKLFDMNGFVLLLGVSIESCYALHYAQYDNEKMPLRIVSSPVAKKSSVIWKDMIELNFDNKGFKEVGEILEDRHLIKTDYIGNAICSYFSFREAIRLAKAYYNIDNM